MSEPVISDKVRLSSNKLRHLHKGDQKKPITKWEKVNKDEQTGGKKKTTKSDDNNQFEPISKPTPIPNKSQSDQVNQKPKNSAKSKPTKTSNPPNSTVKPKPTQPSKPSISTVKLKSTQPSKPSNSIVKPKLTQPSNQSNSTVNSKPTQTSNRPNKKYPADLPSAKRNKSSMRKRQILYEQYEDIPKILERLAEGSYKLGTVVYLGFYEKIVRVKGYDQPVYLLGKDCNRCFDGEKVIIEIYDKSKWMTKREIIDNAKKARFGNKGKNEKNAQSKEVVISEENEEDHEIEEESIDDEVPLEMDDKSIDEEEIEDIIFPRGRVVYVFPRDAENPIRYSGKRSKNGNMFMPFSNRAPAFFITNYAQYNSYKNHVFTVEFDRWSETDRSPIGRIVGVIENGTDIDTQLKILLSEVSIDESEYPEIYTRNFPKEVTISDADIKCRLDLRDKVVISIDPPTARDIDDAVSIEVLPNGHFKLGVHIADVTHYVKDNDPIDKIARSRAITFYFSHKVIPMLPEILSSNLCSLMGGKDRLSFSVVWEMDSEGTIYDTWMGKTIIHSSAKLSYTDATDVIENSHDLEKCKEILKDKVAEPDNEELLEKIIDSIISINRITENLRSKRFKNGVLRIENYKLKFEFENNDYHHIKSFKLYEQTKSSYLIEELMIQANISVATKIKSIFPNGSLLRYHPPPKESEMNEIEAFLEKRGFSIDTSSVESLAESQSKLEGVEKMAFSILFVLALNPSIYYCTNENRSVLETRHYGLNIDLYTHFTSPIRRYADIIVHRILDHVLSLKEDDLKKEIVSKDQIEEVCEIINRQQRISRNLDTKCEDVFISQWMIQQKEKVMDDSCLVLTLKKKSNEIVVFSSILKRKVFVPLGSNFKIDEKSYEVIRARNNEPLFKFLSVVKVKLDVKDHGNRKQFIGTLVLENEEDDEQDDNKKNNKDEKKNSIETEESGHDDIHPRTELVLENIDNDMQIKVESAIIEQLFKRIVLLDSFDEPEGAKSVMDDIISKTESFIYNNTDEERKKLLQDKYFKKIYWFVSSISHLIKFIETNDIERLYDDVPFHYATKKKLFGYNVLNVRRKMDEQTRSNMITYMSDPTPENLNFVLDHTTDKLSTLAFLHSFEYLDLMHTIKFLHKKMNADDKSLITFIDYEVNSGINNIDYYRSLLFVGDEEKRLPFINMWCLLFLNGDCSDLYKNYKGGKQSEPIGCELLFIKGFDLVDTFKDQKNYPDFHETCDDKGVMEINYANNHINTSLYQFGYNNCSFKRLLAMYIGVNFDQNTEDFSLSMKKISSILNNKNLDVNSLQSYEKAEKSLSEVVIECNESQEVNQVI